MLFCHLLLNICVFAIFSIICLATPPSSPKGSKSPKLERFYSTQSSFGSRHEDHSSTHSSFPSSSGSSSPPHSPKKQSNPVNIARKMTAANSAGAAHSIVKAIVMTPTQLCAGAAGCIRQKIAHEKLKRDPKATPEQINQSKETLRDHRKHMLKAPVGEIMTGAKNAKEFIHLANQNHKAVNDLKKQELRQNIVTTSTRTTNGMDRFSDQAWKDTKKGLKEHSTQQWKDSAHLMKLGATGKDSQFSLGD